MAKQMIPMPSSNSILPKLIGIAVLIALVVVVVKYPGDAAKVVQTLLGVGEDVVDGIAGFLHQLAA